MHKKKTKTKKSTENKAMLWLGIVCLIAAIIVVCVLVVIKIKKQQEYEAEQQKAEIERQLNACLDETEYPEFEKQLQCYDKYGSEGHEDRISILEERLASQRLSNCLNKAIADYAVTDEERNMYYGNVSKMIELLSRTNDGYTAQIACYNNYGDSEYSGKKAELEQKIADNNNRIAVGQSYLNSGQYNPSYWEQNVEPITSQDYGAPTPQETPSTPSMSCDDYRNRYYTKYQNEVTQAQSKYHQAIEDASLQCASRGQSSCPQSSSLGNQLELELAQLRADYESNMASVGCNP